MLVILGYEDLTNQRQQSAPGSSSFLASVRDLRQLPTHSSRFTVPLIESFQELTNAYINFNILARNSIHYYGGYVAFKFLNVHNCMYCENALTIDKPNNVSRDYQLFTAMKGYSPDSIFSNLKVCTDPYYKLMTYLEHNFNDAFNQYKMKPRVGELIFCYYVYQLGVGKFLRLCCQEAFNGLLKFYIKCKIYFTLRFKNREFSRRKNASNLI